MYDQEKIKPYSQDGSKTEQVIKMFDNIAPAYDKLNHLMSFGIDRRWRKRAINSLRSKHPRVILDMATGTGDFAILACEELHPDKLIGTDISEGMIDIGRQKVKDVGLDDVIQFTCEDCCHLSFDSDSFDAITVAFGVRNFSELDKGLTEMCRVLRKGGSLVILELSAPEHFPMKQLFFLYSKIIIPAMGRFISKDSSAYHYLPKTIQAFPQGEVMKGILEKAGFTDVKFKRLTCGVCTLYIANK